MWQCELEQGKDLFTEGKENWASGLPKNISASSRLPCRGKKSVQLWLFRESVLGLRSGRSGVIRQRHSIDTSYGTNTSRPIYPEIYSREHSCLPHFLPRNLSSRKLDSEHAEELPSLLGVIQHRRKKVIQFAAYHHDFKSSSSLRDPGWTEVVWNRETGKKRN